MTLGFRAAMMDLTSQGELDQDEVPESVCFFLTFYLKDVNI